MRSLDRHDSASPRSSILRWTLTAAALMTLPLLSACSHESADERQPIPTPPKASRDQIIGRIKSAPMPPAEKEAALRKFEQEHPAEGANSK